MFVKLSALYIDKPFGFILTTLTRQARDGMFWFKFEAGLVPSGDVAPKPAPLAQRTAALQQGIPEEEGAVQLGGAL